MSLILNIDTAGSNASIALAVDGEPIAEAHNSEQRDHASWIHEAIIQLLYANQFKSGDLSAIAVTIGPGSYTGLRVGLATAKGFCYALNIPLITENTLRVMAFQAISRYTKDQKPNFEFFIPMIDARRMEVFTAVYDEQLNEIVKPQAMILEKGSFENYLTNKSLFFGNGSIKFRDMQSSNDATFEHLEATATDLSRLSHDKFLNKWFSDIVYSDPLYLKEFYSPQKK
jgi:tRNA threonylcarbamoyladenosine biosynthesis protein TsaB